MANGNLANLHRTIQTTQDDHLVAWLAALAITIHIAESALPMPMPGVKPGLTNVITVAVLLRYSWRIAAWVAGLRVLVGSLLLGTFLSPTFFMSLGGTVASLAVLAAAWQLPGKPLGAVGYSVLAALAHMSAQFWVAYTLFVPHPALLTLLPVLMTAALIFGAVNGIIAATMLSEPRTA